MSVESDLEEMRERMRKRAGKGARRKAAVREPETSIGKVERARDRKRKNSRTKGSNYERKIAKKWTAWSGEHIRRTPQSGGWSTARFGVTGDLVCDNPSFPFHIECKKREGWCLDDLLTGVRVRDTRSVMAWWEQTLKSCPPGKQPVLVFARNNQPDLMMLRQSYFVKLCGKDFTVEFLPHFTFALDSGVVVILALDDFFAKVRPPKGCAHRKGWSFDPTALVRAASINDNIEEVAS